MEGVHTHLGEDGGEGLSVLPRHTKVLVTGNNRTKSVLVGLQGVVTKAVGLGGWHWLVKFYGILVGNGLHYWQCHVFPTLKSFSECFSQPCSVCVQMLTNGDEVKLQRNALSVIERPSGHEETVGDDGGDDDVNDNEDNPFSSGTSLGRNLLLLP